ncbi:hypothetical protein MUN81_11570 [Hymenobacter sp. 5317J-9]|uniref:hypothetical protein n=1 Tax=Hymenobacter sp. 5317J-9 TaxID=2932250 RepID=UPI001FD69458|nr:hypothetical protein [Hymenobacter sp. 5317J-9]UOQ95902.1 hypothetical protein MUN81_11570 [Hymenobacter sp. 5317J-9]
MHDFKLWLEFEHVDYSSRWVPETDSFVTGGEWDRENEACNVIVDLPDGRHYGINVWTYAFLATAVALDVQSGENLQGTYQKPPDLFVKALTRECIEVTIADLLQQGNLEDVLNPSVLGKPSSD